MAPTFYFGRPGALQVLPSPQLGLSPTRERRFTDRNTTGGGRVVDYAPGGRRTYNLSWTMLTAAQLSQLEEFFAGVRGPGPFVLLDPARVNHLTANQSSGGAELADGTGFTAVGGETLTAQSTVILRGPQALRWSLPTTPTSGVLEVKGPGSLPGVPVPAGQPWTFQAQLRGGGADPNVSVTAALAWLRTDGSVIETTLGTPVSLVDSAWQQASVSRSSPPSADTAYVKPQLRTDLTTVDAGDSGTADFPLRSWLVTAFGLGPQAGDAAAVLADWFFGSTVDIYLADLQLAMSAAVSDWVTGTGVPQVSWTTLPDTYPLPTAAGSIYHDLTATLLEVG